MTRAMPLQFLRAIAKDTAALVPGAASIALLCIGMWVVPAPYENTALIFAAIFGLGAAYRLWACERKRSLSLLTEHHRMQESASELGVALEAERTARMRHHATIEAMEDEVARLRAKQMNEQQGS